MLKIIYILSCIGAWFQVWEWFKERIKTDEAERERNPNYGKERYYAANAGAAFGYLCFVFTPGVNTFLSIHQIVQGLGRIPLVRPKQRSDP